jgi:hypothetical protein
MTVRLWVFMPIAPTELLRPLPIQRVARSSNGWRDGEQTVLTGHSGVLQPAVSKHLAVLKTGRPRARPPRRTSDPLQRPTARSDAKRADEERLSAGRRPQVQPAQQPDAALERRDRLRSACCRTQCAVLAAFFSSSSSRTDCCGGCLFGRRGPRSPAQAK